MIIEMVLGTLLSSLLFVHFLSTLAHVPPLTGDTLAVEFHSKGQVAPQT